VAAAARVRACSLEPSLALSASSTCSTASWTGARRSTSDVLAQRVGCRQVVGPEEKVLDGSPVDRARVQAKPHPTPRADIGRNEIPFRVLRYQAALLTRRRLGPQSDDSVAMMVVAVVPEDLLPHLEREMRRRARDLHLRQGATEGNQPFAPPCHVGRPSHESAHSLALRNTRPCEASTSCSPPRRPARSQPHESREYQVDQKQHVEAQVEHIRPWAPPAQRVRRTLGRLQPIDATVRPKTSSIESARRSGQRCSSAPPVGSPGHGRHQIAASWLLRSEKKSASSTSVRLARSARSV